MSDQETNLLMLNNPETYSCAVHSFRLGHRLLVLKIRSSDEVIATFAGVVYFSGPISWRGANLTFRPVREAIEMLRAVFPQSSFEENNSHGHYLFSIVPVQPQLTVQFLGRGFDLRRQNEKSYYHFPGKQTILGNKRL
jgi:hypothetical protein